MACCVVVNVSHGLRVAIKTCWIVIVVASFYVLFLSSRHANNGPFISSSARDWCPIPSPKLIGWTNISSLAMDVLRENQQHQKSAIKIDRVREGGRYEPAECQSRNHIAIVVPYRNRADHLAVFLRYMHPFLQRQQLSYVIIVVEQSDNDNSPFNRGMLMNIGFSEAQQLTMEMKLQCVIFHDVDLLPENDANPYSCPQDGHPRQMSFSIDYLNHYKPTARNHFGGVTALSTSDFRTLGGYSNAFWGWGGEDDELYNRVKSHNMTVTRAFDGQQPPSLFIPLTRYTSLSHPKAKPNPDRKRLLKQASTGYLKTIKADGGLATLVYKRLDRQFKPLYTHVVVDIHP